MYAYMQAQVAGVVLHERHRADYVGDLKFHLVVCWRLVVVVVLGLRRELLSDSLRRQARYRIGSPSMGLGVTSPFAAVLAAGAPI
jgi:hypothetical protein